MHVNDGRHFELLSAWYEKKKVEGTSGGLGVGRVQLSHRNNYSRSASERRPGLGDWEGGSIDKSQVMMRGGRQTSLAPIITLHQLGGERSGGGSPVGVNELEA